MPRTPRPDDWLSIAAAAARLGVSARTVRRYTNAGKLPDTRSAGGRRIFRVADLDVLVPSTGRAGAVVLYGRVSSGRQQAEGDLDRQIARLREAATGRRVFGEYTDIASGLSDRRAGLRRALVACQDPAVDTLLVTHPQRLARFGVGEIEQDRSAESDLVRDMLAIVTSFAGRLYGQRSVKARRVRVALLDATDTPDGE